jgi:prepilin-type N-terminal cleavage/methylation domain-containing protein
MTRKGFTLLEMMVASLLLGMLVTVLTMLFNSSAVAWRTGTAGVSELKEVRMKLGVFHDVQDDILPGLGDRNSVLGQNDNRTIRYRTVSLWDPAQDNRLRVDRAYDDIEWLSAPAITIADVKASQSKSVGSAGAGISAGLFTVGVRSRGPDGLPDTEDDITTWPDQID